ncbi:hypothetical protein BZL43_01345 [Pseudomonas sp. PICF141]|nr:hypothetical protein BZL43_01345 [Pseudomonas sp. PICF141]
MARALNKNKKPETNNKNRACNYFLGSFGSPCGFCDLKNLPSCSLRLATCSSNLLCPTPSPD